MAQVLPPLGIWESGSRERLNNLLELVSLHKDGIRTEIQDGFTSGKAAQIVNGALINVQGLSLESASNIGLMRGRRPLAVGSPRGSAVY